MKKKLCILTVALAGIAALSLAGCGGASDPSGETKAGTYRGIQSAESVYGVAAVTTARLLAVSEASAQAVSMSAPAESGAIEKAKSEAEDFNKYFNMLDTFLDKAATTTVVEPNGSEDEALAGYEFKLTIKGKNAAGEDVPHTVYYTETEKTTKTATERDRDGESETSVTETYTLDGVVEMGTDEQGKTVYYYMSGTRTEQTVTETDGREEETEHVSTLVMKASADREASSDYVLLTHTQSSEEEADETETEATYTYQFFKQGIPAETTVVNFESETEQNGTETEYSVAFLNSASRGTYTIERETKGTGTEIVVEYLIDGTAGRFTIVKDADGFRYRFSENAADDEILRDFFD